MKQVLKKTKDGEKVKFSIPKDDLAYKHSAHDCGERFCQWLKSIGFDAEIKHKHFGSSNDVEIKIGDTNFSLDLTQIPLQYKDQYTREYKIRKSRNVVVKGFMHSKNSVAIIPLNEEIDLNYVTTRIQSYIKTITEREANFVERKSNEEIEFNKIEGALKELHDCGIVNSVAIEYGMEQFFRVYLQSKGVVYVGSDFEMKRYSVGSKEEIHSQKDMHRFVDEIHKDQGDILKILEILKQKLDDDKQLKNYLNSQRSHNFGSNYKLKQE